MWYTRRMQRVMSTPNIKLRIINVHNRFSIDAINYIDAITSINSISQKKLVIQLYL